MDKLAKSVHRVGARALAKFAGRFVPGEELAWFRMLRDEFVHAANAGELSRWGVTDGAQLEVLDFQAPFVDDEGVLSRYLDKIVSHIKMLELRRNADAGSVVAQGVLGIRHVYGYDVPVDYAEGLRLLSLAAKAGASRPTSELARLYERGLGVAPDLSEAVRLYGIAASKGEFFAQIALGRIYADQRLALANPELARTWFSAAVSQGDRVDECSELEEARAYLAGTT